MAKGSRRAVETDQTTHYIVYDRRTGEIVAVHHVTALAGVRPPTEPLVRRRVLACAADSLGRRSLDLRVTTSAHAPVVSPGVRVDVATGAMRTETRARRPRAEETAAGTTVASSRAWFPAP